MDGIKNLSNLLSDALFSDEEKPKGKDEFTLRDYQREYTSKTGSTLARRTAYDRLERLIEDGLLTKRKLKGTSLYKPV